MKSIRCLVSLPILALSIGAQAFADTQLPDRPAAALTMYKDKLCPVLGAQGNAPIIVADGNQVVLGAGASIALSVGDRYADGFVKIDDLFTADVPPSNDPNDIASNEMKASQVDVKATLTPDIDIPDAYAILIAYPPSKNPDAAPVLAAVVHKIGDLAAGRPTRISVRLPKLGQEEGPAWSILVFDAGRQVRSTGMDALLPGYLDRLETAALKKRIADRLGKGVDAPIAVLRPMPLSLPDTVKAKYHGTTVKVEVRVGVDGRVVWARPVGLSDTELFEALNRGFSNWLFLPPMKDGALAPGSAIIPLKL
jgi:hypothetical protein